MKLILFMTLLVLGVGSVANASPIAFADWKPIYRCVDLDDESPIDFITIFDGGGRYFASYRTLSNDGSLKETKTVLTFSRAQSQNSDLNVYAGNGLTIQVDRRQAVTPGLFAAFLSLRDLQIATYNAQCKDLIK
jgi:hypothetical protein